jgi:hypothetical protein
VPSTRGCPNAVDVTHNGIMQTARHARVGLMVDTVSEKP